MQENSCWKLPSWTLRATGQKVGSLQSRSLRTWRMTVCFVSSGVFVALAGTRTGEAWRARALHTMQRPKRLPPCSVLLRHAPAVFWHAPFVHPHAPLVLPEPCALSASMLVCSFLHEVKVTDIFLHCRLRMLGTYVCVSRVDRGVRGREGRRLDTCFWSVQQAYASMCLPHILKPFLTCFVDTSKNSHPVSCCMTHASYSRTTHSWPTYIEGCQATQLVVSWLKAHAPHLLTL